MFAVFLAAGPPAVVMPVGMYDHFSVLPFFICKPICIRDADVDIQSEYTVAAPVIK